MKLLELIAVCHFGLESVSKKEIFDLGYEIKEVRDGRVIFYADYDGLCRANIFLRTVERIMISVGEFKALSFEELFENIYHLSWEKFLPKDANFPIVKAVSVRSKLFSTRHIQSITKKSIATRLGRLYSSSTLEESGAIYPIRVNILNDMVSVAIDSSGESLHKRGYRTRVSKAPLSETLAASIIKLTPYYPDRMLIDPFCGSGTIAIEAAMIAKNIAAGIKRTFPSMKWSNLITKKTWDMVREEAYDEIVESSDFNIQAYDIDESILRSARDNAIACGVDEVIHFQKRAIKDFSIRKPYGFVITNPPYGRRLESEEDIQKIYTEIGEKISEFDTWSFYVLSGYEEAEKYIGKKASKNRKIYNGMLKTYLYQYLGKKPPKVNREKEGYEGYSSSEQ